MGSVPYHTNAPEVSTRSAFVLGRILARIRQWLERIPRSNIILFAIVMVLFFGVLDCFIESEISISIFYLIPIWLVTERAGFSAGCLLAMTSASAWILADAVTGHVYSHPVIPYWNGIVRCVFFLTVAVALHLRRKAGDALRHTQAQLVSFFELAPDPMMIMDERGMIVHANKQMTTLIGYSRDELIGTPAERLLAGRFRSAHPDVSSYLTYQNLPRLLVTHDLTAARKDGSEFPVEVSISPTEIAGQYRAIVMLRDISARKVMEVQLREHSEGRYHTECDAQILKLKREINLLLAHGERPKRYDV